MEKPESMVAILLRRRVKEAVADELDRIAGPETPGSPTERVIGAGELRARARELRPNDGIRKRSEKCEY